MPVRAGSAAITERRLQMAAYLRLQQARLRQGICVCVTHCHLIYGSFICCMCMECAGRTEKVPVARTLGITLED